MKPVPDTVACVTVIFEPPGFVTVTACVWLVPTLTALKLIVEGFNMSCPPPANAVEDREKIARNKQRQTNSNGMLFFEPRFLTARPQTPCQSCAAGGIEAAVSRIVQCSSRNTAISVCGEQAMGARYQEDAVKTRIWTNDHMAVKEVCLTSYSRCRSFEVLKFATLTSVPSIVLVPILPMYLRNLFPIRFQPAE